MPHCRAVSHARTNSSGAQMSQRTRRSAGATRSMSCGAGRHRQRNQRDDRQIGEVVGHERVAHRIDIEETQRRREHADVAEHGDQRTLPMRRRAAYRPMHHRDRRGRGKILPPERVRRSTQRG